MHHRKIVSFAVGFYALFAFTGCGWTGTGSPPEASISDDRGTADAPSQKFDMRHPTVVMQTSLGDITVELDSDEAPLSVDNFLTYVDRGAYDHTLFHQVDRDFMALAGGYHDDMSEVRASLPVRNEADNGLKNIRGTIAMARRFDVIDGATSQFFFNLADNKTLDYHGPSAAEYGYCVFGQIKAGQDVLNKIAAVSVRNTDRFEKLPAEPVRIESIRRLR